ncbi:hypothetical protein KKA96_01955 [Patescibacteria group bacterium]|nr:hypothetical protein [Patescibacteria group bacterium]
MDNLAIPSEFIQKALDGLPNRPREVIIKRFNLDGRGKKTLEQIGKDLGITRERARQIEKDAFKKIAEADSREIGQYETLFKELISRHGGAMEYNFFLDKAIEYFKANYETEKQARFAEASRIDSARLAARQALILISGLTPGIKKNRETKKFKKLFYADIDSLRLAESAIGEILKIFESENKPMRPPELLSRVRAAEEVLDSYLRISAEIAKNPYGEIGPKKWPRIFPRSARDKAYLALFYKKEPAHFRKIAQIISASWPAAKRKVLAETVHNELIKDKRVVLVGRGIYALAEWGYERGTAPEIIKRVLEKAERPMSEEEIIREVSLKRLVKPSTIVLNLKNAEIFEKTEEGMYKLK